MTAGARAETPTTGPSAGDAPPSASASPNANAGASASRAATALDLLHTEGVEISVSSQVENSRDVPANLVDGDPSTSWSSRTGTMTSEAIWVRMPEGASVERLELTAGMTAQRGGQDLFTMNPRVRAVRVWIDGVNRGTFALDVESRALQTVPVRGGGGLWRIELSNVLLGTRRDWREVSVSELRFIGTRAGAFATGVSPRVRVRALTSDRPGTRVYELTEGRPLGSGCVAYSPRLQTMACFVGAVGHNLPDRDESELVWKLVFVGATSSHESLTVLEGDAARGSTPTVDDIAAMVRQAIRARLTAGDYRALEGLCQSLRPGQLTDVGPSSAQAALRWSRRLVARVGDNGAARYTERVELRFAPATSFVTLATYEEQPRDDESEVYSCEVPGTSQVYVISLGHYGDEGVAGMASDVWRCDVRAEQCAAVTAAP